MPVSHKVLCSIGVLDADSRQNFALHAYVVVQVTLYATYGHQDP